MTPTALHLISFSIKVAALGGIAWLQLYLLRRAPASARSRLCSAALVAILLLGAVDMLAPGWTVKAPVFTFTAAARSASTTQAATSIGSWVTILWMIGAGVLLIRALAGRAALALTRRRAERLEPVSGVEVRTTDLQTPVLVGLVRPAILLPAAARTWSDEQRRMVLMHELTHLRQGDCWTNLLAQIVRAIFWFHPAVWLLVSRLSREQELTCDEAVVAAGHAPHEYAQFLLDAVRDLKSREMFACAMAGSGARSLKRRFANLLDTTPRLALTRRAAGLLASLALVAFAMTAIGPVWSQTQEGKAYKVGNGVLPPKLLHKVEPQYDAGAKDERIEGMVRLKCVITPEGNATDITIQQSLDSRLDERAVQALSQWTFQPGTKDGAPVAVWAVVEVNFRLK